MKDKLEPNMYVRTKNRGIAKFMGWSAYDENKVAIHTYNDGNIEITPVIDKNTIIKASHNIIDLIEDEDIAVIEYYVSKYRQRITRMFECSLFKSKEDEFVIFENKHCDWWYDKNKKEWTRAKGYNPKIKSIVTKEQLEAIQYVVK